MYKCIAIEVTQLLDVPLLCSDIVTDVYTRQGVATMTRPREPHPEP